MNKQLLFICILLFSLDTYAQQDSLSIKLKQYKDYLNLGLIDSQEYNTLKRKALGLPENDTKVAPVPTSEPTATTQPYYSELCYDTTKANVALPKGLYMSIDEIRNKNPSLKCNIIIKLRKSYDYQNGVGGNVILSTEDNCISKKKLTMDVWIYSDGTVSYINLEHLKLQGFYNPIITMGRFLAFYKNQTTEGARLANAWGGSIVNEIALATGSYFKKLYVIDLKTAMLYPVDDENMTLLMKDYPTLYVKYQQEKNKKDALVCARYLQAMNETK